MLHHPFDSYEAVEEFIEAGAMDPAVISMKQTLYRTSKDSPIFRALIEAAQSKDVTVVVELMARFDEDSNIRWARELEDAGVGVFHGIVGLKTHCKLALLVRRDPDGVVRRYAHLGTGNYNPVTARFYTDISLLTAHPEITETVQQVFNYLTAETETEAYKPLMVAPLTLWDGLVGLIDRETEHAKAGKPAAIVAKMNGLLDRRGDRGAVRGIPGGRGDRPDYSRHVLAAAGSEGPERADSCEKHRGPVSGAQPDLQLCERRQGGDLLRQRGLDAEEPDRALRGGLPGDAAGSGETVAGGDSGGVSGGQYQGTPAAAGWGVHSGAAGRRGLQRTGVPDARGGGVFGEGTA